MTWSSELDLRRFREVLGHYPTGVAVVTSVSADGTPIGMVVGSFTSVSLEPPLVAYYADQGSSTFARLRESSQFVVNVLGAEQEVDCRRLVGKDPEFWNYVAWRAAPSGAPILDSAVAWVECEVSAVTEVGDHYAVLGKVTSLDVGDAGLPLLFFQGGYGRFVPLSLVVPSTSDLVAQVGVADLARGEMERLAADLQVECVAQAVVGEEIVHVASVGPPDRSAAPTRVGIRIPFVPPFGGLHVAWAADRAIEAWLGRSPGLADGQARADLLEELDRVRRRGWSIGLGSDSSETLVATARQFSSGVYSPELEQELRTLMESMGEHYEPLLSPDQTYRVRFLGAPIFGADDEVILVLKIFGLPERMSLSETDRYRTRLLKATEAIRSQLPWLKGEQFARQDGGGVRT